MLRKVLPIELILLVLFTLKINGQIISSNAIRFDAPAHVISGEHISLKFYAAIEAGECAKNDLQSLLYNFLETLQKNLSTSYILNAVVTNPIDVEINRYQLTKFSDLADYFQHSSETAGRFAQKAELFFETSKIESKLLLHKLRQVPSAQHFLPTTVKVRMTDYFAEMEYFHVMFSEIIDQALEYIVDNLRSIQRIFIRYADIQRDILRAWNFKSDEWCYNTYLNFLQEWSAQIFKCGTGNDLQLSYDVYATTETFTKYIMRQLEYRIQRMYNCFIFRNYEMRCQFLRKYEQDFEKLFAKLDELQQYFDIKIKHGRVTNIRFNRSSRYGEYTNYFGRCIPYEFPSIQMISSLKTCFNFPSSNQV